MIRWKFLVVNYNGYEMWIHTHKRYIHGIIEFIYNTDKITNLIYKKYCYLF
jgi:hypothetical protein